VIASVFYRVRYRGQIDHALPVNAVEILTFQSLYPASTNVQSLPLLDMSSSLQVPTSEQQQQPSLPENIPNHELSGDYYLQSPQDTRLLSSEHHAQPDDLHLMNPTYQDPQPNQTGANTSTQTNSAPDPSQIVTGNRKGMTNVVIACRQW